MPADVEWLHLLVGDWQLLSDLSFADLVLWVRESPTRWQAVAHVRPTTGQMVFYEDQVATFATRSRAVALETAYVEQRILRERDTEWRDDLRVREEQIPVVREGRAVAVLTRHTNLTMVRTPSRLELTYFAVADALSRMIASGDFPHGGAATGMRRGAPRVGDGVLRLDEEGTVLFASPNAVSAMHRLGFVREVVGANLAEAVTSVLSDSGQVDEGLAFVLTGRQPWRTEVASGSAVISMRAIPLTEAGQRFGAVIVLRDVSELRRRERELLTKDATIREVHHRVKNNLQSVAALLRLQARRVPDDAGRAALREAERRVGTIALVHEVLSNGFDETVDFDRIAETGLRAVVEVMTSSVPVTSNREGSFGLVVAQDATPLALVMSELLQNAIEHGAGPDGVEVVTTITREPQPGNDRDLLRVAMRDHGPGLPEGRLGTGLGTQIVKSFVQDLGGRIEWRDAPGGGTVAEFTAQLRRPEK